MTLRVPGLEGSPYGSRKGTFASPSPSPTSLRNFSTTCRRHVQQVGVPPAFWRSRRTRGPGPCKQRNTTVLHTRTRELPRTAQHSNAENRQQDVLTIVGDIEVVEEGEGKRRLRRRCDRLALGVPAKRQRLVRQGINLDIAGQSQMGAGRNVGQRGGAVVRVTRWHACRGELTTFETILRCGQAERRRRQSGQRRSTPVTFGHHPILPSANGKRE